MGSPEAGRWSVTEDEFGGFRIVIPVGPKWYFRLVLPLWLCGWSVVGVGALRIISSDAGDRGVLAFMIVWLCGWTFGGFIAILSIAWNWFGREVVVIDEGWMETRHELCGLSRSRSFELSRVRGLRYSASPYNAFAMTRSNNWQQWGFGRGTIAVDYHEGPTVGTMTYHFGDQLPEPEAQGIIQTIRQRVKIPEEPALESSKEWP
jgi:hypothetical protein